MRLMIKLGEEQILKIQEGVQKLNINFLDVTRCNFVNICQHFRGTVSIFRIAEFIKSHGVTSQKTLNFIVIAMGISDLTVRKLLSPHLLPKN
jgi:hypothetical protein